MPLPQDGRDSPEEELPDAQAGVGQVHKRSGPVSRCLPFPHHQHLGDPEHPKAGLMVSHTSPEQSDGTMTKGIQGSQKWFSTYLAEQERLRPVQA